MRLVAGQVAVVTGGASGIGLALCEALTARGIAVVVADLSVDASEQAASRLRLAGGDAVACPTDVRDASAVEVLAAFTLERYGRVDLVCNNAGVVPGLRSLWEQDPATWRWVIDVALLGVAHGISLVPVPLVGPYGAAKYAVVGMSETLDAELRMVGSTVGVTVLCPARVATALEQTSYAARPDDVALPLPDQEAVTSGGGVLTAGEVARIALEGVEAGKLHVLTHPESAEPVRRRVEALLGDL
jgi:NAD(P)-dependent dehydrogenase (short-subunit alcohol dehydrogenase family)